MNATGLVLLIVFLVYIALVGLYYYAMPDTEAFAVYESEEEFEEMFIEGLRRSQR